MPRSEPTHTTILLRLPEAAAMIGFSTRWLQERVAAGGVPVVHIEGRARMRRTDVESFARDGRWPGAKPDEAVVIGKDNEINPHVAVKKRGART